MVVRRDMKTLISVVICTRNRAESLRRTLQSLVRARPPVQSDVEVVIVDNGSTDATPAVVRDFSTQLNLRGVIEARPGLSFARNSGVVASRGDYVLWTDDDVTVEPDWLAAYDEAFKKYPDAAFFGGVIRPVLEGASPDWLPPNRELLRYLFAERAPQDESQISAGATDFPFGASFAVRADFQRQFPYDTELGASPIFNRLGEEERVMRQILDAGGVGRWVPGAVVNHHIPEGRQTLEYVAKYNRAVGETWAYKATHRLDGQALSRRPILGQLPIGLMRTLVFDYLRYRYFQLLGRPEKWLPPMTTYAYCQGAIRYLSKVSS